jgi:hypothetical protein
MMHPTPPLRGTPRPPGLERRTARVSGAPVCSMKGPARNVCLTKPGTDDGAVLRVEIRSKGKERWTTYYLCAACAEASGDTL